MNLKFKFNRKENEQCFFKYFVFEKAYKNDTLTSNNVLVVAGPGNNGGDGSTHYSWRSIVDIGAQ